MNTLYTQALPLTKTRTKVVVTEHEVMLGSAAALAAPHRETHRRRTVVAWFVSLRHEPRLHPQSRRDFTEYSRMAREMYRL
ncbi:hypothetical protein [Mycolicibacterium baixiangningiae]|uniref:hypothetical protein n=1 Tax=Mycolicibacterium baixiangningiae TaxID=2761578 RepID=UPI001866689A|nr:hypothetical protein [Mycolicibacterium baixiangningiae]